MTVQSEITRIQNARNTLRTKAVALGIGTSTDKLPALATAFSGIENQGGVSASVREGETYSIPAGYHNGSGTVTGVGGGGNYTLQDKTVTPTTEQQTVTPDSGNYGLSSVVVEAIPSNYHDVSPVTATAADVLATKIFVDSTGVSVGGTMPNREAGGTKLTTASSSYAIQKGYYNGTGSVTVDSETKTATPTEASQTIKSSTNKFLTQVTVNPIPSAYTSAKGLQDSLLTKSGSQASHILAGDWAIVDDSGAKLVEGTMTNRGAVTATISGLGTVSGDTSYTIPAGYHNGSGTVSLTADIENALKAI